MEGAFGYARRQVDQHPYRRVIDNNLECSHLNIEL